MAPPDARRQRFRKPRLTGRSGRWHTHCERLQGWSETDDDAHAGHQLDYHFNGFDNYVRLMKDDVFSSSFRPGLIWAFSVPILRFLL